MSIEIVKVDNWIAHEIGQDTVITDIIGNEYYKGYAPPGSAELRVVYNYVAGTPILKLGMRRHLVRLLYDIVVWQRGQSTTDQDTVAFRLDELFSHFRNRQWGGWNFSSEMETPLAQTFVDNEKDETWEKVGNTYQITTYIL